MLDVTGALDRPEELAPVELADEEELEAAGAVDELPAAEVENSRTRLSSPSLTHRFPDGSIATPSLPYMFDCETLNAEGPATGDILVKFGWPTTIEALSF